jgi:hypothetical protein
MELTPLKSDVENGILTFKSSEELNSTIENLSKYSNKNYKAWADEKGIKTLKTKVEAIYKKLEKAKTKVDFMEVVDENSDLFYVNDNELFETEINSLTYVANEEKLFKVGDTYNKLVGDFIVTTTSENLKELKDIKEPNIESIDKNKFQIVRVKKREQLKTAPIDGGGEPGSGASYTYIAVVEDAFDEGGGLKYYKDNLDNHRLYFDYYITDSEILHSDHFEYIFKANGDIYVKEKNLFGIWLKINTTFQNVNANIRTLLNEVELQDQQFSNSSVTTRTLSFVVTVDKNTADRAVWIFYFLHYDCTLTNSAMPGNTFTINYLY